MKDKKRLKDIAVIPVIVMIGTLSITAASILYLIYWVGDIIK
ncbi:MAG: hypothetical protein E6767_17425 [Dysgonomonas sp.]|nr:hypothetical protein [Dysgonomonas sp.]